jgi:hypothetical protein
MRPSGNSELCGSVAVMVMTGGSMSTEADTFRVWRDSLPADMPLSAVSLLVVALPVSEFPEGYYELLCIKHVIRAWRLKIPSGCNID